MTRTSTIKTASGEPAIDQQPVNGWTMTWNPDDGRWYVGTPNGIASATFAERRNAVQYAKTHTPPSAD